MSRLPIQVAPHPFESASGYLLRALGRNGASVDEAMSFCRTLRRSRPLSSDVDLLAELVGVPTAWLADRTPVWQMRDQWLEARLFGCSWRQPWLLRGIHQQVCPACLEERGVARLEWDLLAYPVCHLHDRPLHDACGVCGRAISPTRPALDVCDCGAYLTAGSEPAGAAPTAVLRWCSWLSKQLLSEEPGPDFTALGAIAPQLRGASPDGAFRMIFVFGGGTKAYRGARIRGKQAWLGSQAVGALIDEGLEALRAAAVGQRSGLSGSASLSLTEQTVAGVTAWDCAIAAREMRNLKLGRRWRDSVPRCPSQQELFEDPTE